MKFKIKALNLDSFNQDKMIQESEKELNLLLKSLSKFNLLNNEWMAFYKKKGADFEDQLEDCKNVKEKLLDLMQTLERIKNQ